MHELTASAESSSVDEGPDRRCSAPQTSDRPLRRPSRGSHSKADVDLHGLQYQLPAYRLRLIGLRRDFLLAEALHLMRIMFFLDGTGP